MADKIFVRNQHNETRYFDARVWAKMTNKYGWKPVSDTPPEVAKLQEKQSAKGSTNKGSSKATTSKATVKEAAPLAPAPATTRGGLPRVQAVMDLINAAGSAADIDAITKGDSRPSIQKAAQARKDQLK